MIINKISELRKEKNITQIELANKLNISRQTIISLEDNKSSISLELAFKISKYFNLPIEEIFMEKDMCFLNNKKAATIEEIKHIYGKNTIFLKGDLIYRCSTGQIEAKYHDHLLNYELPKYGQMNKFVIIDNKVYELIPTREYNDRNDFVRHTVGKEVNIDPECINFNAKPWNEK